MKSDKALDIERLLRETVLSGSEHKEALRRQLFSEKLDLGPEELSSVYGGAAGETPRDEFAEILKFLGEDEKKQ